jgi:hypothetical protein
MARTKAVTSIRLLSLTAAATVVIMSAASSADAPNPWIGKWALDLRLPSVSALDPAVRI